MQNNKDDEGEHEGCVSGDNTQKGGGGDDDEERVEDGGYNKDGARSHRRRRDGHRAGCLGRRDAVDVSDGETATRWMSPTARRTSEGCFRRPFDPSSFFFSSLLPFSFNSPPFYPLRHLSSIQSTSPSPALHHIFPSSPPLLFSFQHHGQLLFHST